MVTDKFHFGLGVAPTLYVQPQTVFDLSIMAKVGYRLSKHCELGLSYQYGCLNTLKHFNTTIINPFPTSVEKALLFVFFRTGKGFSPTLTRNTYLFVPDRPGKPRHRKQRACNRILPTNVTDKFHFGLGVAPTLYVQPQTVFDLSIMAKVGYRLSKHCELGLSYQYGCLNTLKHFNTTIINPFPTSVEKALLFVFFRTGKGFSPTLTRNTYLFVPDRPGKPRHRKQRACNRILPTNVSLRHPNVGKLSDSRLSFNEFFLIYF